MLIDHGALINITNNEGNTPKHHAAIGNSTEAIAMLIDHGALINITYNEGNTPKKTLHMGTQLKPLQS